MRVLKLTDLAPLHAAVGRAGAGGEWNLILYVPELGISWFAGRWPR